MLTRTVLAVAVIAFGITTVVADVIADRKALMKRSGAQAKIAAAMKAGREPFDLVKAKAVFEAYVDKANKLPTLFPPDSKTGGDTNALPAIWDKPADWNAAIAKFGAEAKAALAATTDKATFDAQLAIVQRNCGACHENFKKS